MAKSNANDRNHSNGSKVSKSVGGSGVGSKSTKGNKSYRKDQQRDKNSDTRSDKSFDKKVSKYADENSKNRTVARKSAKATNHRKQDGEKRTSRNHPRRQEHSVDQEALLGYKPMYIEHAKDSSVKVQCPYFEKCGGCQLLDVKYEESLSLKQKAIEKIVGSLGNVLPIIGMENPYHYRNKSVATFAPYKRDHIIYGMYEGHSHDLVSIDRCLIQDERADKIVETIHSLMKSFKMTAYSELSGRGFLRHVLIRVGQKSDEIMVVMVTTSQIFPGKNNFIKIMKQKHPEITTLVMNINDKDTTMVLGEREIPLYGPGHIRDELCGLSFRISPQSFYQINPVQTEVLYDRAMEMADLSGNEIVLDAYSGIGTIGLIAAGKSKQVIGVELNKDAVRDAIGNAKGNHIKNARFFTGDAGEFMVGMASEGEKVDVVFMDPPRSGLTREFIKAIGKAKPNKVVYISCGPESLARDLKWLKEEGYQVKDIQPVDMFPWTNHVECVVGISRKH